MATTDELAGAAAHGLTGAAGSLRAALGVVGEVHERLRARGQDLRQIRSSFTGEDRQRYDQLTEARDDARRLAGRIGGDQELIDDARTQLRHVRIQTEDAGRALGQLQAVPGHDQRLAGALAARVTVLRTAASEAEEHLDAADRRLGSVREGLGVLDRDTYLHSAMDGESLGRGVDSVRTEASTDLGEARISVAEGRGGLRVAEPTSREAVLDAELLAAQKGLNPTPRGSSAAASGQGERDLHARLNGLDGVDRERD